MNRDRASGREFVVVMVVASEDDGGMARSVYLLARYFPDFGITPHVVVHRESGFAERLRRIGVRCELLPDLIETGLRGPEPGNRGVAALAGHIRRAPRAIAGLRAICARVGARVLYSHGTWSNYLASLAGRSRHSPPVVWHIRNDHSAPAARMAGRSLARLGGVRAIIAVSDSAARPYEGVGPPLVSVLNGVDYQAIDNARRHPALRSRPDIGRNAILVGYAGRLEPHKGIDVLMRAFAMAAPHAPETELVVLGATSRHSATHRVAELQRMAAEAGLSQRVRFPGYVTDIEAHIADLDIMVVPSICRDSCPRAAVEALALGVPVIGSDIGGIPELITTSRTGLLVPAGSADALAKAIVDLAADGACRSRMAAAAAADARKRFDARISAARIAELLREVAAA